MNQMRYQSSNQLSSRAEPIKEEEVIDLAKYGDNPDPKLMTSPEKKLYRETLLKRSEEVGMNVKK